MANQETRVSVIGLGNMGGHMAGRLLAAGFAVQGYDRDRDHAQGLIDAGLEWRESPRAGADGAEFVLTSLPDDGVLEHVATEEDGLLAGLAQNAIWIDLSTVSPKVSREIAEKVAAQGPKMLDAPVSGSVPQVESGTLTIMVGGDEDAFRRAEPVLRALGTPTYIGGNGQGLALKLAINISLALQMEAFAEGLLLATRSGVEPRRALEVMESSPIGSEMLKARSSLILEPPESAWFTLAFMHKDIELALDTGRHLEVPLPTTERVDEVLERALALGHERDDLAAIYQVLGEIADGKRVPA
ncbi:MAG TPA: NAD(P)-dependent oxidoreductase [Solirubrobacteraceae bacterium]|jgi:3-hydroxyisobutyrate dehydrogenase-like beta-hydroxyacid dehydrogenase|nr:NAD(P)-dependent oxidoreductase [Solirubrobacteraceae bacterium]